MYTFQLKDRVCLRENSKKLGMIVQILGRGKCKILWDADWESGRTYVYNNEKLERVTERAS